MEGKALSASRERFQNHQEWKSPELQVMLWGLGSPEHGAEPLSTGVTEM